MCGLCGVWRGKAHWTARVHNPKIFVATGDDAAPLRERFAQMTVLNRVLRPFGVSVRDWEGSQWIVDSVNGGSEIVANVAALWPAAERLSKRKIDPLSATLLDSFTRAVGSQEY